MSVNTRQQAIAIGKVAQADLVTASGASDLFRITKINRNTSDLRLVSESDAQDVGKDDEFASQNFLTNWDTQFQLETYLCSELAGFAAAFGLGNSVDSTPAVGAYRHTAVFQSSGIDLHPFTYAEKMPADGSALDRAIVGGVLGGATFQFNSGPGRQNAKLVLDVVGTGNFDSPSGITLPAPGTLHSINAGGLTITINGNNYITSKRIISLEFGFRNNVRLDSGFFPGSGSVSGANIRGRMEHGDRECFLRATIRREAGADEFTKYINQTEGTAVITGQGALITGSTYHDFSATFHRVVTGSMQDVDADGIAAIAIEWVVMKHASNGVLTLYATNEFPLMGAET